MFVKRTFQDYEAVAGSKLPFIVQTIADYKNSDEFLWAKTATQYFEAGNTKVSEKKILRANVVTAKGENGVQKTLQKAAIVGNQVRSNFLFRFVTQQNQFLLGNGVTLSDENEKAKLGLGFDKAMEQAGEKALLHGVCWAYWNLDHIEIIPAYSDDRSGFVALLDERTGKARVGIHFWQMQTDRPMYFRLFEEDGLTEYVSTKDGVREVAPKRAYVETWAQDVTGARELVSAQNYTTLPLVPFFASESKSSELNMSIKTKIDMYDNIMSDFGDNLEKANDVYWVLNNFGGTSTEILETIQQIEELRAVVNISDGMGNGSTAHPEAFEVPYAARQTALEILCKELHNDYMALNKNELTGGSLTNVAIEAAMIDMNLKADRYEWQAFQFVQGVLALAGVHTEKITFKRQTIVNRSETVSDIAVMRQDIDQETALKLNPYIMQEEIEKIIANTAAEQLSGMPTVEMLERVTEE